ncbi:MAG: HAD family hydrolase [Planctomycetia bacterium]|nr:HAD family hydrolase [Planctomycetia bacterium]
MLPFRAVLFDLDGTLIDSFAAIAASVNHVRAWRGLGPLSEKEVMGYVGRGAVRLMADAIGVGDPAENLAAYSAHHPSVIRPLTRLLPNARETLVALHGQGKLLGICSNKPVAFTRELMDHLGLIGLLSTVLGPEDVGRPKPAPDMLVEGMRRLKVSPTETLYVGDMTVDIDTGRAAGVTVWAVPTGIQSAEQLGGANRILSSLNELT